MAARSFTLAGRSCSWNINIAWFLKCKYTNIFYTYFNIYKPQKSTSKSILKRSFYFFSSSLFSLQKSSIFASAFATKGWPKGVRKQQMCNVRGIAQSGSVPGLGPGGRRFESCYPDEQEQKSSE